MIHIVFGALLDLGILVTDDSSLTVFHGSPGLFASFLVLTDQN
jgi:hypothetical protein